MEKLTIVLDGFGNAAFEDNLQAETARILRKLADSIEQGALPASLMDINGNKVGKVIAEEASVMKWHDDINQSFQPLLDYAKSNQIEVSDYMYMGHDSNKYYYKHHMTREYIHIDHKGNLIQK